MNERLCALVEQCFHAADSRPPAVADYLRSADASASLEGVLEATLAAYAERGVALERQAAERDASERQTENLLQLLGTILESSAEGILAIGQDDRIARFNGQFAALFRLPDEVLAFWHHDEVMASVTAQLLRPDAFRDTLARLCAAPATDWRETIECRDGRVIEWRSQAQPAVWAGIKRVAGFLDVTDRFRSEAERQLLARQLDDAQQRLLEAEKMVAIGQLAAGVAHEINNPVSFISGNMGALRRYANDLLSVLAAYERWAAALPPEQRAAMADVAAVRANVDLDYLRRDLAVLLQETQAGILRVKTIVKELGDFARLGEAAWQATDLHQELDGALAALDGEIAGKAQVVRDFGTIAPVECQAAEIRQVFRNLLANAAHAIDGAGTITLRSGRADGGVWVEVADSGAGIAPEHLARIFEPFFTTRPVGQGTGLGLAVAYGIVRKHGGRIEVDSRVGQGSVFRVWLPERQGRVPENAPLGEPFAATTRPG